MESGVSVRGGGGTVLNDVWTDESAVGKVFRLPEVQGIVQSLVGEDPLYDHHAVHIVPPRKMRSVKFGMPMRSSICGCTLISNSSISRTTRRCEMGGTMILPGSHYRRVCETDIARYQNFLSQLPVVCEAGTLFVVHHGMWHCAQHGI